MIHFVCAVGGVLVGFILGIIWERRRLDALPELTTKLHDSAANLEQSVNDNQPQGLIDVPAYPAEGGRR